MLCIMPHTNMKPPKMNDLYNNSTHLAVSYYVETLSFADIFSRFSLRTQSQNVHSITKGEVS